MMVISKWSQINFNGNTYGKTKLICWSTGPLAPTLNENKKIIIQNFGQLDFFKSIIFCFLKKKEVKHNKYINNENRQAFIVL